MGSARKCLLPSSLAHLRAPPPVWWEGIAFGGKGPRGLTRDVCFPGGATKQKFRRGNYSEGEHRAGMLYLEFEVRAGQSCWRLETQGLSAGTSREAGVLSREAEAIQATRVPGLLEGATAAVAEVSRPTRGSGLSNEDPKDEADILSLTRPLGELDTRPRVLAARLRAFIRF